MSLRSQLHTLSLNTPFSLPLYPELPLGAIDVAASRVMGSKQAPLFLVFQLDTHNQIANLIGGQSLAKEKELQVLVKQGDDLRQDELMMRMLHLLQQLLDEEGIGSFLQCYACMAEGVSC